MKISVIIPIYNVSRFIDRCAESLMRQTLNEVEYIFINDATPDNSIVILREVIARYPKKGTQVKILEHEYNMGLPAARNTGLAIAKGEYIFHCDSDDYVEPTMLEELYKIAKKQDADYVWCDWYLSFEKNERYMVQPYYTNQKDALRGILCGTMKYNVWNKLVKRSLYLENCIQFPAGHGMGEDMTMIRLLICAKRVAYVPQAFYHYVKLNGEAFTNNISEKHLVDIKYNVEETLDFIKMRFGDMWNEEIGCFKLNTKWPFLISDDRRMYQLWKEWFPEANKYILSNKYATLRSRCLQYAATKGWWGIVWLHYRFVHKFIYGIIYK